MKLKTRWANFKEWIALPGGFGIFSGLTMLATIIILGVIIPNFGPYKSDAFVGEPFAAPSLKHPFGLDQLGRDLMTRTFSSVGVDLGVAFLGVSLPLVIGTVIGIVLGLAKNKYVLSLVGSLIDGINAFPLLIIAVAMLTFLGSGLKSIVIILAITNWARYARISRTRAVVVSKQNYIEAAKTLGYSKKRIILKHMTPNVSSETVAYALSDFILVIIIISGLSFLGLGAQPPTAEWGSMIADGRAFLTESAGLILFPGLALCWSAVALSFIVEGISRRDRGI
jgi:peptide/nickel transport system permease protein